MQRKLSQLTRHLSVRELSFTEIWMLFWGLSFFLCRRNYSRICAMLGISENLIVLVARRINYKALKI